MEKRVERGFGWADAASGKVPLEFSRALVSVFVRLCAGEWAKISRAYMSSQSRPGSN